MLSGVGVVCFAGSYAVALGLELSRLVFRSGVRGALLWGWAAAGLVAHTAYLAHEAARETGSPLSSARDWYLVAAWLLVVVYLYLSGLHPQIPFGLFVLPLVLALVAVAVFVADPGPNPRGPASAAWGVIHGGALLLATVAVLMGFVAGLMYLYQARRLKHKQIVRRRLRLPSLEWLARANHQAIVLATAALVVGVAAGMVLVARSHAGRIPWNDPVVLSTWSVLAWLGGATLLGMLYPTARAGRRVAWLTVASFVVLAVALGIGLFAQTEHGGRADRLPSAAPSDRPAASPGRAEGGAP